LGIAEKHYNLVVGKYSTHVRLDDVIEDEVGLVLICFEATGQPR